MKTPILSYFSLLLVAVLFFSCESNTKAKLEGTWKLLQVPEGSYEEDWIFASSDIKITHRNSGDTATSVFKFGTYSIKNKTLTTSGEGMGSLGDELYRGDFEIHTLNSTQMVLLRKDLGLQYYEFEKKQ